MAKMDSVLLKSKFRGCLLGALLGDCLGAPFEGDEITAGDRGVLQRNIDKLEGPYFNAPYKQYTDDTAMMKSVAKCLIDKPPVDYNFMARLFVKEFFNEPKRGYGQSVVDVFYKLRANKFEDIYKPATEQFDGTGSYGNGGAMRIAPIALHFHNNYQGMIEAAKKATKITHTHELGVNGAVLQSIAVHQSLQLDPNEKVDVHKFALQLIENMKNVETAEDDMAIGSEESTNYQKKLETIQELLKMKHDDDFDDRVIYYLGNEISAFMSVPTAIFCFLRAQNDIPGIKTDNVFRRTIQYAISLGGDTDTIASMAGSIVGAHLGEESVNKNLRRHCEAQEEILKMADNLFMVSE